MQRLLQIRPARTKVTTFEICVWFLCSVFIKLTFIITVLVLLSTTCVYMLCFLLILSLSSRFRKSKRTPESPFPGHVSAEVSADSQTWKADASVTLDMYSKRGKMVTKAVLFLLPLSIASLLRLMAVSTGTFLFSSSVFPLIPSIFFAAANHGLAVYSCHVSNHYQGQ